MFQKNKMVIVALGGKSTCDVMHIGTMKINMFDRVIRTLSSVVYAPRCEGI